MNQSQLTTQSLKQTVIDGEYCIGCGACAAAAPEQFSMKLNNLGMLQAEVKNTEPGNAKPDGTVDDIASSSDIALPQVCPFADGSPNEDELSTKVFSDEMNTQRHAKIGMYLENLAGHVVEEPYRKQGSSGGFGTWIAAELFRKNMIDGVVHVKPRAAAEAGVGTGAEAGVGTGAEVGVGTGAGVAGVKDNDDKRLFEYGLSTTLEEIHRGSGSRYHPVELSKVMGAVREREGRYAIVGIPCFIKAARLLAESDPILKERLVYFISIFCGHLKSMGFAQMLGWQAGVHPDKLVDFDFRTKLADRPANAYGITATTVEDGEVKQVTRATSELYGTDWGMGFFKYNACDYCDDVVGETADIAVGDAWLPQYVNDSQGTNVIIVRRKVLGDLIHAARDEGRVDVEALTAEDVARSQDAGFRHRHDGLTWRLQMKDDAGEWRPEKRVEASRTHLDGRNKKRMELRVRMARTSHVAFAGAKEVDDFEVFREAMRPIVAEYRNTKTAPWWRRKLAKLKKKLKGG